VAVHPRGRSLEIILLHHSVKALTDGRVIILDYPVRGEFGQGLRPHRP